MLELLADVVDLDPPADVEGDRFAGAPGFEDDFPLYPPDELPDEPPDAPDERDAAGFEPPPDVEDDFLAVPPVDLPL